MWNKDTNWDMRILIIVTGLLLLLGLWDTFF